VHRSRAIVRWVGSIFFLGAFLLTFIPQNFHLGHDHHDHDHEGHHHDSSHCEDLNPCHLAIYHFDHHACDHEAHIFNKVDVCEECSKIHQETNQFVLDLPEDENEFIQDRASYPVLADAFVSEGIDNRNARGPPVSVLS